MELGVVLQFKKTLAEDFKWCIEHDIATCQLGVGTEEQTPQTAEIIKAACSESGLKITALVGAWSGPNEWNFYGGPLTLGIVPPVYRANRLKELMRCADFAAALGVSAVCTHMGFIPENPNDSLYSDFVCAARHLGGYYKEKGISLNFETGQETPVTLMRVIEDIGLDNIGLNFDPANLLMYGKANPIDAVDMVGKYINGVHAKDGEYPTNGRELGREVTLGTGMVHFPEFIKKLKAVGYDGAITIEREISGERQKTDVLKAVELLKPLI